MRGRLARSSAWCATSGLAVLVARTIAYALAPQPSALSVELGRSAGGAHLVVVTLVALGCASTAAVAIVGFAALAVRERLALERALVLALPGFRPLRVARRSAYLFVATATGFALVESYVHWRAGLGWHGLRCLTGPVHRDALPLLAALSLVGAAVGEAIEHLLAWARRAFARPLSRPRVRRPALGPRHSVGTRLLRPGWCGSALPARGPPVAHGRASAARAALDI
jgi:hypothetical protein